MRLNYLQEDADFALKNCKMLYKNVSRPCTETCACWGFEFGNGWNGVVKELSVKLEMLNILFYPKYGVRVVMDQSKEKFGTLHFYYSVNIDSPLVFRIWHMPFEWLYRFIQRKIKFNLVSVIDKEGYYEDEKEEIPEGELENRRQESQHISNVKVVEENGKWYSITHLYHCPVTHIETKNHKFLYKLMNIMKTLSWKTNFHKEPTAKQLVIQEAVNALAAKYISEAEDKCYNVCEDCGNQIGTEWSPRVTTDGWINYICEKCDARRKINYRIQYIENLIKRNGLILMDDGLEIYNQSKELMASDDYVSLETYKECAVKIEKLVDKIDKKLSEIHNKENANG